MMCALRWLSVLVAVLATLTGCTSAVSGTPTWPGARLEKVVLTAADFPDGVQYDRIIEEEGVPDGAGGPPPMLSDPPGCSEGFSKSIGATAERGAGSAAKYVVGYNGARMLITVLSWSLDTETLQAIAERCERFVTYFGPGSPSIPMTTTALDTDRDGALVYQQTMELGGARSSVFFSFENVGSMAVFGVAFPTPDPRIPVKATLPQTFLEAMGKQAERLEQP
ncbi:MULTISPECIES: hypothetical protein [Mycolicibacterium]|uniref:Lipoprotein LpqN n=1 Tax=Mycolicibacterium neoaurum TaxID=1795 RepID=A0AAV2WFS3_MYCNE|nr:hypothetical protein [Mycolicibacterium neoaurum]QVI26451.1 hypothetical protein MN2019_19435 [Mycolicibacterium neoaurum]CDQ43062.1 hypothetical protein BN1047_00923 [Mycolicibacterium neoaurum]